MEFSYFKSLEDIILFYSWCGLTMNGGLVKDGRGMDGCLVVWEVAVWET